MPARLQGECDATGGERVGPPYFDPHLQCWVVSRYADVMAAFREPSLTPGKTEAGESGGAAAENVRLQMRAETAEALCPAQLNEWRARLAAEAAWRVDALRAERAVDLLAEYGRPLGLSLAAWVTGISREAAEGLSEQARVVSLAAADPDNLTLKAEAQRAEAELAEQFCRGPVALRDSTFVALCETVPCMLANAWLALMEHPRQWRQVHAQPELLQQAMEELLRYAGLVRRLFRTATEDVMLHGARIRKGDRLLLQISAANHDAERFACPHLMDVLRRDAGHVALGGGLHACVGAGLIRMAAQTMTEPLLRRFACAELAGVVVWRGGATFRSPQALWAELSPFFL
jgi:cytochrome P450